MNMKKNNNKRTFLDSVYNCLEGIDYTFKNERNFRIEILIGIIVVIASFLFKINILEWIVVILLINFVLIMELLNTAIESAVDLYSLKINPLSKIIKDVSSGAVLVMCMFSAVIGILIFLPKILK